MEAANSLASPPPIHHAERQPQDERRWEKGDDQHRRDPVRDLHCRQIMQSRDDVQDWQGSQQHEGDCYHGHDTAA
jgi:hypothetical protein